MVEPQAQNIPRFYHFCTEGTSFNPGCLSEEVPEHITAEQTLPRSANDWGAQERAGANSLQPLDYSHQALLSMEFFRQEYWSGLPCPSPADLSNPGTEPGSCALQADSLLSEPPEKLPKRTKIYFFS